MGRRFFGATTVVSASLMLATGAAHAGTVSTVLTSTGDGSDTRTLNYQAAPGEFNDVRVVRDGVNHSGGWIVSDTTAPVTAGPGCTSLDASKAYCPFGGGIIGLALHIDLGDEDDTASISDVCPPENKRNYCASLDVYGGPGRDVLYGTDRGDGYADLHGGPGDDYLFAGARGSTLDGGSGNDHLIGSASADRLYGGSGNDQLWGYARNDYLSGGSGNDTVDGGSGNDTISGGAGNDNLLGRSGNDTFYAKDGYRDTLNGGSGSDHAGIDRKKDTTKSVEHVHG